MSNVRVRLDLRPFWESGCLSSWGGARNTGSQNGWESSLCTSSNYKKCQKTMTTDLKTNYDAEACTSDVEKNKTHRRKQNFEDEANNMRLD